MRSEYRTGRGPDYYRAEFVDNGDDIIVHLEGGRDKFMRSIITCPPGTHFASSPCCGKLSARKSPRDCGETFVQVFRTEDWGRVVHHHGFAVTIRDGDLLLVDPYAHSIRSDPPPLYAVVDRHPDDIRGEIEEARQELKFKACFHPAYPDWIMPGDDGHWVHDGLNVESHIQDFTWAYHVFDEPDVFGDKALFLVTPKIRRGKLHELVACANETL